MSHYQIEREAVARAVCNACGEKPEHSGDTRWNEKRWQDYLEIADAAINALIADGVLIRLERHEGYEDVHPELLAEDAINENWPRYTPIFIEESVSK